MTGFATAHPNPRLTAMRRISLLLLLALFVAGAASAQPDRAQRQAAIESDAGLPERARAALFRARTARDDGDDAGAVTILRKWLAGGADRDNALMRFELGVSLLDGGQADSARVELKRAVAQEPAFARAWLRLGEASYEAGTFTEAADAFQRAYDLLPDPPADVLHYAAVCRLQAGDAKAACDLLEPLVAADVGAPFSWYQALAAAALAADAPARARPYLRRLVAARPDDREVWDLAWRFAAGTDAYEDAAVLLKAEGFLGALDAGELDQLGQLFAAVGIPLEAARAWEQAAVLRVPAETDPDDDARLARAWLAAHEPARARAVLEAALAARGDDASLFSLLGDVNLADQDLESALSAYAQAAALAPGDGRAQLMAGWCAFDLGRDAEARRFLTAAAGFEDQAASARSLLSRLNK